MVDSKSTDKLKALLDFANNQSETVKSRVKSVSLTWTSQVVSHDEDGYPNYMLVPVVTVEFRN